MGRFASVLVLGALGSVLGADAAGAARIPERPTGLPGGGGPAVGAANQLLADAWRGVAPQFERDGEQWTRETTTRKLAGDSGKVGPARWSFSLRVTDDRGDVDLGQPPQVDVSKDQFRLLFPGNGSWLIGTAGRLKGRAKVKVGGETIFSWSPSVKYSFSLARLKTGIQGVIEAQDSGRPILKTPVKLASATPKGSGSLPLTTSLGPGSGSTGGLSGNINGVSLNLPGLSVRLYATMSVVLEPSRPAGEADLEYDARQKVSGTGAGDVFKLHTDFQEARVIIRGYLRVKLKRVGTRKVPFEMKFDTIIPSSEEINRVILALQGLGSLPRRWGEDQVAGHPTPPPTGRFDLGAQALEIEKAIPAHMPNGGVLALDNAGPGSSRSGVKWAAEADSAIWTGHYLAAEAFRYSKTRSAGALARVKGTIAGFERLMDVTDDAVVEKGKRSAVPQGPGRLLARTAAPGAGSYAEGQLSKHECYYENPEGGWNVSTGRRGTRNFATYREALAARAGTVEPTPQGALWRGIGCGSDHPVSRDQIAGFFLGLSFAHQLVDDPDVRSRSARMMEDVLDYLIATHWVITTPPGAQRGQSYFGLFEKQLSLLRIGATINAAKYGARYRAQVPSSPLAWLGVWFSTIDPLHQYYKFNLSQATLAPAIFLEDDPKVRADYQFAHQVLNGAVRHHKNAYFTALQILNRPAGERAAAAAAPSGSNPAISRADEIKSLLESWLDRRKAVPGVNGLPLNAPADPAFQASLWPNDVRLYTTIEFKARCAATYALPPAGRSGSGMDFAWQRQPFQVAIPASDCNTEPRNRPSPDDIKSNVSAKQRNREGPGVDYLLPYWMSVYLGVLPVPADA